MLSSTEVALRHLHYVVSEAFSYDSAANQCISISQHTPAHMSALKASILKHATQALVNWSIINMDCAVPGADRVSFRITSALHRSNKEN